MSTPDVQLMYLAGIISPAPVTPGYAKFHQLTTWDMFEFMWPYEPIPVCVGHDKSFEIGDVVDVFRMFNGEIMAIIRLFATNDLKNEILSGKLLQLSVSFSRYEILPNTWTAADPLEISLVSTGKLYRTDILVIVDNGETLLNEDKVGPDFNRDVDTLLSQLVDVGLLKPTRSPVDHQALKGAQPA